jgi:hypothetical protein
MFIRIKIVMFCGCKINKDVCDSHLNLISHEMIGNETIKLIILSVDGKFLTFYLFFVQIEMGKFY